MLELDRSLDLLCSIWEKSTRQERLELCNKWGLGYDEAKSLYERKHPRKFKTMYPQDTSWEKQIEVIKQMDNLIAYHQFVPSEIAVSIKTTKPVALAFTADWHLGMFGVDYDSFYKDINTIETEDGLHCFIGGDGRQNMIQPSKLGSSHNQTPIAVQNGLYVLTIKKLLSKIVAVGTGNHNYWTTMAEGEDWDREITRRLKLVYTKHSGRINIRVGKISYPVLRLHKSRYNSSFNLTHSCKQYQRMHYPDARVIVIEHNHIADMEQYRYNERECVAIRTGTYGVYDDYAQQNGFFGAHVATPTIVLFPDKDKVVGFKDMYDAITYLRAVR